MFEKSDRINRFDQKTVNRLALRSGITLKTEEELNWTGQTGPKLVEPVKTNLIIGLVDSNFVSPNPIFDQHG